MRGIRWKLLGLGVLLSAACDDGAATAGTQGDLEAAQQRASASASDAGRGSQGRGQGNGTAANGDATRQSDAGVLHLADGGAAVNLTCPRGGDTAPVAVQFACDRITVVTCKDLSNVVIEFDDASRQRVEGLQGHSNVFVTPSGRTVVGVWVKAGSNHSGDGPGYGERVNAPAGPCADAGTPVPPPVAPPGQTPPVTPPTTPPQDPPPSDPPPPGWLD